MSNTPMFSPDTEVLVRPAPENILQEADRITTRDRAEAYGHPSVECTRIAALWSTYLGIHVEAEDVPIMMILLKISREVNAPKRDNLVDIAGYARVAEKIHGADPDLTGYVY